MNRFLAESGDLGQDTPELSAENLRHLKVLRPKEGEVFELFDGAGKCRRYAWRKGRLEACGEVAEFPRPRPLKLFACITKGSRWDWTLEKATELGVTEIVPVISARTIVRIGEAEREQKRERWERICRDAARQCDTKFLPKVRAALNFADTLKEVRDCRCLVGALTEKTVMIAEAAREALKSGKELAVYVGPEGDFSPEELSALCEAGVPVSFGANVLRAETAAIFAVSVIRGMMDVQAS